jgi:hypothetical protein
LCSFASVHAATIDRGLGRHPDCRFRGATTVLPHEYYEIPEAMPRAIHDTRARLFFYNDGESDFGDVYGCVLGVGRAVRLGPVDQEGSQGGGGIVGFTLGGVFAATNSSASGHPQGSEAVVQQSSAVAVFDLRSGRRVLHWSTRPPNTNVKTLVVTTRGAAAWVTDSHMGRWTLLASTRGGAVRSLQTGAAQSEPPSLSLTGDRLSWTSSGVRSSVILR